MFADMRDGLSASDIAYSESIGENDERIRKRAKPELLLKR